MRDAPATSPNDSARRLARDLAAIVAVSLVASVPFCNKAFHIDDTLYLAIARQILVSPLRPFDGEINWQQVSERTWNVSISPPGYSYWLAAWMKIGVSGEIGLHLVGAIWTVVLAAATYFWARRLGTWPVTATVLVVSGPLVTAGQNLMLDVPMLALATGSIAIYWRASERNSAAYALLGGFFAGLAVNVKYAAVVAIGVMAIDAIAWRRRRLLVAPLLAITLLAAGQFASFFVYGQPQLAHAREWITRLWPSDSLDALHRASSSVMYLGASCGLLPLVSGGLFRRSRAAAAMWLVALIGAAAAALDLRRVEPTISAVAIAHAVLFALGGWLAIGWIAEQLIRTWRGIADAASAKRHAVMLVVWTIGFWYLGTLNGPFLAPRSVLPWLLSIVLAIQFMPGDIGPGVVARLIAAGATLVAGLLVGAGDFVWAGIYRERVARLVSEQPRDSRPIVFFGHWGWQHYAESAGMVAFDPRRTRLESGDIVVVPQNADAQNHPALSVVIRRSTTIARDAMPAPRWLPRTRSISGFIFFHGDTDRGRIPWGWPDSDETLDEFVVLRFGD